MATVEFELLGAFEVHSVEEIRAILDAGFDVRSPIKGKSAVNSLTLDNVPNRYLTPNR
jgi:hypothetical protein